MIIGTIISTLNQPPSLLALIGHFPEEFEMPEHNDLALRTHLRRFHDLLYET
jgi:hypothetical protein